MSLRTVPIALFVGLLILATVSQAHADFYDVFTRQPHGPTFDCAHRPLTWVERQICATPRLAALDLALNDAYAEDAMESDSGLAVIAAEAAWLRRRDVCRDLACIARAYQSRMTIVNAETAATIVRWKALTNRDSFLADPPIARTLAKMIGARCLHVRQRLDLGDGRASLLGRPCDVDPMGDRAVIFHPNGGTYRIVYDEPSEYVTGICCFFQRERSHGLRGITTFSRSTAAIHSTDFYAYDGSRYRHVTTIWTEAAGGDKNFHEHLSSSYPVSR